MTRLPKLQQQCVSLGWPLVTEFAERAQQTNGWLSVSGDVVGPELLVLQRFETQGECGCWCEGGSINLLMKAAALEVLASLNTFRDRRDAVRRYFEAQCTILKARETEIVEAIRSAQVSAVRAAATEICTDEFIHAEYPLATKDFIVRLWTAIGADRLAMIAQKFFEKPYDFRAGWPDLTLIDSNGVHFVEVKTTDCFQASQLRFATEFATPLGLRCGVVRVKTGPQSGGT